MPVANAGRVPIANAGRADLSIALTERTPGRDRVADVSTRSTGQGRTAVAEDQPSLFAWPREVASAEKLASPAEDVRGAARSRPMARSRAPLEAGARRPAHVAGPLR